VTRAPIIAGAARSKLRQEMRAAYEDGLTIHQVAARFGRSYGTTHKLLTEAQTPMRPRGGPHGR
jgi:DNA-directed RNA polymerase specialized sigma24 family protein